MWLPCEPRTGPSPQECAFLSSLLNRKLGLLSQHLVPPHLQVPKPCPEGWQVPRIAKGSQALPCPLEQLCLGIQMSGGSSCPPS